MSKILLVDDEQHLTSLMSTKLHELGHDVQVENCCKKSFARAKEIKPDCIILDVMLGDGAGYQVSRQLRKDPELFRTPILFMSTLAEAREVEYSFEQGGDEYLTKPFSLEQLVDKLKRLERLSFTLSEKDPVTKLSHMEALKRQIDYRLLRNEGFALHYAVTENFDHYRTSHGEEEANKVLRFISQLFMKHVRDHGLFETFIAHAGRGHFFLLTQSGISPDHLHSLQSDFNSGVKQYLRPHEVEQGYIVETAKKGSFKDLMHLSIHSADTASEKFASSRGVFNKLRFS